MQCVAVAIMRLERTHNLVVFRAQRALHKCSNTENFNQKLKIRS